MQCSLAKNAASVKEGALCRRPCYWQFCSLLGLDDLHPAWLNACTSKEAHHRCHTVAACRVVAERCPAVQQVCFACCAVQHQRFHRPCSTGSSTWAACCGPVAAAAQMASLISTASFVLGWSAMAVASGTSASAGALSRCRGWAKCALCNRTWQMHTERKLPPAVPPHTPQQHRLPLPWRSRPGTPGAARVRPRQRP